MGKSLLAALMLSMIYTCSGCFLDPLTPTALWVERFAHAVRVSSRIQFELFANI